MATSIFRGSRERKWEFFTELFPPHPDQSILDLGVSSTIHLSEENYFLGNYPYLNKVTGVGIQDMTALRLIYPDTQFVQKAAADPLPFPDNHFDVVHSNAVVEHVPGRAAQEFFIDEAVRVAKCGFITTPSRSFPFDTHSRLPALHWAPQPVFETVIEKIKPDCKVWLLFPWQLEKMVRWAAGAAVVRRIDLRYPKYGPVLTTIVYFQKV